MLVVVNEVQVAEVLRVVDVEDFRDGDGLDEVQENFSHVFLWKVYY